MKTCKKNNVLIIIPTYNGWDILHECLKSLEDQTYKYFDVLVVNDGSKININKKIKDEFPKVNVLNLKKNYGFAKAVNKGIKFGLNKFNPEYLAILNNDTKTHKNWLESLLRGIKQPKIAAVTSHMLFYNSPDVINSQGGTIDWNGDGFDINIFKKTDTINTKNKYVLGACFGGALIKTNLLNEIGLLDGRYYAYYEDLDWSWRANILGYKILFEKDAILYHHGSKSWKKSDRKKIYLTKRNALTSAIKNYELKNLPKRISYIFIGYFLLVLDHLFFTYNLEKKESFFEKILYLFLPIKAILWNILNLPKTLVLRYKIQKKRKIKDEEIFKLIQEDKTTLEDFKKSVKNKLHINNKKFGVNILGYLDAQSGVGTASQTIIKAIKETNIPFSLNNETTSPSKRTKNEFSKYFTKKNPYPINIITIYGDTFEEVLKNRGKKYTKDKYNIAYWAWELESLPESWIPLFNKIDEIWVPTNFVKSTFKKYTNKPITVIPHSIDIKPGNLDKDYFSIPNNKFTFLFMFDFYSHFERKNPLAIIKSFKKAFNKNDNVQLVIKCSNSKSDIENFEKLEKEIEGYPIKIINKYLSRNEINSLLNICDAYISLHRSEGFGLTIAEAMSLGKPVITTNYSGNIDFTKEENSFLVDYKLISLEKDYGPYKKGNIWTKPNIDKASYYMKYIYKNQKKAKNKELKAKKYIEDNLSPISISKKIKERLNKINQEYIHI